MLNVIDVTYERACMATPKYKYHTQLLETVIGYNDHHNEKLSNGNLRQGVITVMEETEEEEHEYRYNANNVTMDTFCQFPVTTNTQGNIAHVPNGRQIFSNILV